MRGEKVVLVIPGCTKCGRISGKLEFYDLALTNKRIIGARLGRNYTASGINLEDLAASDGGRIDGKVIDEIVDLDRNNFAVPFANLERIRLSTALGQPYIRFRLGNGIKRMEPDMGIPKELAFDGKYLGRLETALRELVGDHLVV